MIFLLIVKKYLRISLKIIASIVVLVLLSVFAVVFFFEDEVIGIFKKQVNKQLATEVQVKDMSLSLFKHFPEVAIQLDQIVMFDAIEGSRDTLLRAGELSFSFDIFDLFGNSYEINGCHLTNAKINLKIDEEGYNNYTIIKPDSSIQKTETPLTFNLSEITFTNVDVTYIDQRIQNNHHVLFNDALAHLEYNEENLEIGLNGDTYVYQLAFNKNTYVEEKPLSLFMGLNYIFEQDKLEIVPSEIQIAQALFEVKGKVNLGQKHMDVKVSAPSGDIQTLLALLPNTESFSDLKTTGDVYFDAHIVGNYEADNNPEIKVEFGFNNAEFYHKNSKSHIKNASMQGSFSNGKLRNAQSSHLNIKGFKGKIKGNEFLAGITIQNFDDPYLNVNLSGTFDIHAVLDYVPIAKLKAKSGLVHFDHVKLAGRVRHLTDGANLHRLKSSGSVHLNNFNFNIEHNHLDFKNFNGEFLFNQSDLGITSFTGQVGHSDFKITGFFKNIFSYLLKRTKSLHVEGDFQANHIDLDELLRAQASTPNSEEKGEKYGFRISPHLSYNIDCNIKEIKFRNLSDKDIGKNLRASLSLNDQILKYKQLKIDIAKGNLLLEGVVDARKESTIYVENDGFINNIDVSESFKIMENFGQTFLESKHLKGNLISRFKNKFVFNDRLELDESKLYTHIYQLTITDGSLINFEPLLEMEKWLGKNKLKRYLKKSDLKTVNFSELNNRILIEDGLITIPTMVIATDALSDITVSGTHGFDQKLNYSISFPLVNYKKEARHEKLGIRTPADKKYWNIYLNIVGTTDDYEIVANNKEILRSGSEAVRNQVRENIKLHQYEENDYIELDSEIIDED